MNSFERVRALGWFFIAMFYFIFAQIVADHAANGLSSGDSFELVSRLILLFLLLVGYAAMGYAGQRQREPIKQMGLMRRPGWGREFALGAALGWGGILACLIPIVFFGGLVVTVWTSPHQLLLLLVDLAVLAVAALTEEIAFRGYPFQRLIEALGPTLATLVMMSIFALIHLRNPGASGASTLTTALFGLVLAVAYLRTRALWLGWGLHFAWNASMGILFGLPISGLTTFSPVVSSNASGPIWITGGNYGLEGSATAVLVLLVLIIVLVKVTRDYAYKYNQPVIVAGGIPVDIDAAARRQHEAAMGTTAAAPALVQIVQAPPVPGETRKPE
ncbi:MAG: CPBP family intramembrane metalloprotease [Acidobacteria bacterium]|nr:CPBP family intramembrane metalloprotease [Acidobacteriota bacterium]MBW4043953.1 CPBP family intramembrane metalloprotease [Acidobacteriota bacterium]